MSPAAAPQPVFVPSNPSRAPLLLSSLSVLKSFPWSPRRIPALCPSSWLPKVCQCCLVLYITQRRGHQHSPPRCPRGEPLLSLATNERASRAVAAGQAGHPPYLTLPRHRWESQRGFLQTRNPGDWVNQSWESDLLSSKFTPWVPVRHITVSCWERLEQAFPPVQPLVTGCSCLGFLARSPDCQCWREGSSRTATSPDSDQLLCKTHSWRLRYQHNTDCGRRLS